MRRALIPAFLLLLGSVVLGATVFRDDIARATGLAQSVTVNNTAADPVPVLDAAANAAASGFLRVTLGNGSPSNDGILYTVPSGKRLVIEYVSAEADTESAGNVPQVLLAPQHNTAHVSLPMSFGGESVFGGDRYVGSEDVRVYADPGDNIVALVQRASASGTMVTEVSFYGHLVDAS